MHALFPQYIYNKIKNTPEYLGYKDKVYNMHDTEKSMVMAFRPCKLFGNTNFFTNTVLDIIKKYCTGEEYKTAKQSLFNKHNVVTSRLLSNMYDEIDEYLDKRNYNYQEAIEKILDISEQIDNPHCRQDVIQQGLCSLIRIIIMYDGYEIFLREAKDLISPFMEEEINSYVAYYKMYLFIAYYLSHDLDKANLALNDCIDYANRCIDNMPLLAHKSYRYSNDGYKHWASVVMFLYALSKKLPNFTKKINLTARADIAFAKSMDNNKFTEIVSEGIPDTNQDILGYETNIIRGIYKLIIKDTVKLKKFNNTLE